MYMLVSCCIISDCPINTSDHLPVKTCVVLSIQDTKRSEHKITIRGRCFLKSTGVKV
ncbi:hypothetical protein LSH36_803g00008 [Paralvinella palmiformis]|uniref:Uncharacterized protein n=1 Tax=Paralvinella palmiformis TaxID=53620 RepID=A0AAD9J0Q8_9ANNE|nr:hypothetical protein LSH36_803g00008 [Paralvinella palmiformis]